MRPIIMEQTVSKAMTAQSRVETALLAEHLAAGTHVRLSGDNGHVVLTVSDLNGRRLGGSAYRSTGDSGAQ